MDGVIGFLVGCGLSTLVGTGLYNSALNKQRRNEGVRLEKLRQELNQAHESELQQTITTLKTEYTQQFEEKEAKLKQEYQQQAESKEQEYQQQAESKEQEYQQQAKSKEQEYQSQLAAAIAAREEAEQSLLVRSEETEAAIAQMEAKHARAVEELKAQMLLKSTSQPAPSAISSQPQIVEPLESDKPRETILPANDLSQLLDRTYHPNPDLRQKVALAIGDAMTGQKVRVESERAIPILGKLSQDPDPAVRYAAVTALARVDSRSVIPYLQRALKDADSKAIAAASEAIAKFKRCGYGKKTAKPAPKNAAARQKPGK
ncbi:MAG: HEAT repeat domain-containing protein [Cyanobacteria bacterium SBLK]|nr:HEAT repeat domain-containing protein [Cyanobacteria bacterium SBLK]